MHILDRDCTMLHPECFMFVSHAVFFLWHVVYHGHTVRTSRCLPPRVCMDYPDVVNIQYMQGLKHRTSSTPHTGTTALSLWLQCQISLLFILISQPTHTYLCKNINRIFFTCTYTHSHSSVYTILHLHPIYMFLQFYTNTDIHVAPHTHLCTQHTVTINSPASGEWKWPAWLTFKSQCYRYQQLWLRIFLRGLFIWKSWKHSSWISGMT